MVYQLVRVSNEGTNPTELGYLFGTIFPSDWQAVVFRSQFLNPEILEDIEAI